MVEFEVRTLNPGYDESCIAGIRTFFDRCITRVLGPKAENGSTRSESGYQRIAASVSGSIARKLGYSEDRAWVLSMCAGWCFPKYGHEGLKVVKQYILDRGIDLNVDDLEMIMPLYYISSVHYHCHTGVHTAAKPLYEMAWDYFHGIDSHPESRIVRLVQNTIMDVKKAEKLYDGDPGNLLFDATQELIDLAEAQKALTKGTLLEPYREQIDAFQFPELSEEQRQGIYDRMDVFVRDFSGNQGDLARFNILPEEAVLTYIFRET